MVLSLEFVRAPKTLAYLRAVFNSEKLEPEDHRWMQAAITEAMLAENRHLSRPVNLGFMMRGAMENYVRALSKDGEMAMSVRAGFEADIKADFVRDNLNLVLELGL